MDENNKFDVVGTNIAEKATMIWNVADMLRGPFKPHEYGLVILPMTVVKRFHDCLLPTHKAVLEKYEEVKKFAVIDGFLTTASQYQFYNISKYTFDSLLADPENIEANFRDYLNGFSANVQDVLSKFDFDNIIRRMVESNTLYLVIKEFNSQKGYLGPDKISAVFIAANPGYPAKFLHKVCPFQTAALFPAQTLSCPLAQILKSAQHCRHHPSTFQNPCPLLTPKAL